MAKMYKTSGGKIVDMDGLRLQNEDTIAVGNMRTNARGDELGPGGKVIKTRNQVMDENYKIHSMVPTDDVVHENLQAATQPQRPKAIASHAEQHSYSRVADSVSRPEKQSIASKLEPLADKPSTNNGPKNFAPATPKGIQETRYEAQATKEHRSIAEGLGRVNAPVKTVADKLQPHEPKPKTILETVTELESEIAVEEASFSIDPDVVITADPIAKDLLPKKETTVIEKEESFEDVIVNIAKSSDTVTDSFFYDDISTPDVSESIASSLEPSTTRIETIQEVEEPIGSIASKMEPLVKEEPVELVQEEDQEFIDEHLVEDEFTPTETVVAPRGGLAAALAKKTETSEPQSTETKSTKKVRRI